MIGRLVFYCHKYFEAGMSPKLDCIPGFGGRAQADVSEIAIEPEAYFEFSVGPAYVSIDGVNFVTSCRSMAMKLRKSFNFHLLSLKDLHTGCHYLDAVSMLNPGCAKKRSRKFQARSRFHLE